MFLGKMSRRHFISVPTRAYHNSPTFHHFTAYLSALMSAPSLPSQNFFASHVGPFSPFRLKLRLLLQNFFDT
jgi:hypothetical protein